MAICKRALGNTGRLTAAVLVALAAVAPLAASQLKLGYLVTFANDSLEPLVDNAGLGPMTIGDSQDTDSNPTVTPRSGGMLLQITRPSTAPAAPVSVGVFATPVSFGPGKVVEERATFISPVGPHDGTIWAVGVGARTGNNNDLAAETRNVATFQVRGTSAKLNAVGATVPTSVVLPQNIYDAIFNLDDPQPFTLELRIDRVTGNGTVSLTVNDQVFSHGFQPKAFGTDPGGPVITAVGPSIAIGTGSDQTASVRLREFRMLLPSSSVENANTAGCPKAWVAFHCRAVPKSH
jgi:hypothetical protein